METKQNDNIIRTLVDSSFDSAKILYTSSVDFGRWLFDGYVGEDFNFFQWLMDGWIDFDKPKFDILWEEIKLYNSKKNKPILKKTNKTDITNVYVFTIPTGLCLKDFHKNIEPIAQFLKTDRQHIKIENINNLAVITVYTSGDIVYNYEDYTFPITKEIQIPIGINLENMDIVYWKPNHINMCHLLIAGNTGSGKSTLIYTILSYLIENRNDVEIYLQDIKRVDMPFFQDAKQVIKYNPGKDYANETIIGLVEEMERRYNYLLEKEVRNMNELKPKDRMKSIIYIIEELSVFSPKGEDAEFFKKLRLLLEQGRSANITIVCITQSPYADTLPGEWKANFPTIIGLKTRTAAASKVIVDDPDMLKNSRGMGHGYILTPGGDSEFQGFNIQLETIKKIVKKNKGDKLK